MIKQLKMYSKMNFAKHSAYKTAVFSGLITHIFFGIMQVMIYSVFLESGNGNSNFSPAQMSSYIWLKQLFYSMFIFYNAHKHIANQIIKGDIAYQLIKPTKIYNQWFYDMYTSNFSKVILKIPVILIFAMLLPFGMGLTLPFSFLHFVLFLVSFLISTVLIVAIQTISYTLVTITLSPAAVFGFVNAVASLLGGQIIPLPMLPKWFQTLTDFFPFRYATDLSFRIYVGNLDIKTSLVYIGVQAVWVVALVLFGKMFLNYRSKKLVVQGG